MSPPDLPMTRSSTRLAKQAASLYRTLPGSALRRAAIRVRRSPGVVRSRRGARRQRERAAQPSSAPPLVRSSLRQRGVLAARPVSEGATRCKPRCTRRCTCRRGCRDRQGRGRPRRRWRRIGVQRAPREDPDARVRRRPSRRHASGSRGERTLPHPGRGRATPRISRTEIETSATET